MNELINKIVCEDAVSLLRQIPDKSVDLVLSDAPYNASNSNLKM
jgi:DNA modification methylase